jgi:hypothetical protein
MTLYLRNIPHVSTKPMHVHSKQNSNILGTLRYKETFQNVLKRYSFT